MRVSFSTGCLYGFPLRGVFRLAAEAGFEGVELLVCPELLVRGPARVLALARRAGLTIEAVHRGLVPIPGWRETPGGLPRLVELARRLASPVVVIHTPRRSTGLDDPVTTAFRRAVEVARRAAADEVTLALENPSRRGAVRPENPFRDPAALGRFAAENGLHMTLDTSHAASLGHDPLAAYTALFRGRLRNLHLSDYRPRTPLLERSPLANHLVQHQLPGAGTLPLRPLLEALAADRYTGNITLEVGPVPLRAWWRPALRRHLAAMATYTIPGIGVRHKPPE